MISSPKNPTPVPTVANVDAKKVASNEDAIPIPYYGGRTWLPLIWAQSNIYNPKTKAVTTKVGKSKQVTGYDYFGSLFGVVACCLTDYLEAIEVAGKIVWAGGISRDGAHVHHTGDIVVDGVGTFRFRWGTSDSPADWLMLDTCGEDHPLYLDMPTLEVLDCYFGNNNATPPTIRLLVERAARFDGLPEDRTREGTNPVTLIAELIGNEFYGLGMPEVVHVASALATANAVRRDTDVPVPGDPAHVAAMGFISPLLDRQQPAQSAFARLLEYFDGWIRPFEDQLYFGRFPHDGVTPGGLPELSYHDFIAGRRPRFEPAGDDDDLVTEVTVVHLDRDDNMEKASTPVPNPAARRRLGFANPKTFQRPFICTTYQAAEQGNQLARHYSRDEEACTASVRRERAVGLHAGDLFVLTDLPSSSSQVVRIVQRTDPADGGEVVFQLVLERGLAPLAFVPPPNPRPILPDPDLEAIANARIFQLPTQYNPEILGPAPAVVVLAQRPGAHVAGYTTHFSTDNVTYDQVAEDGRWALRGTLAADALIGAASFTVNASGFELPLLAAQSDAARDDNTLLAFIGFELCSIGNVVALGGGQYTVSVLRGRLGSSAAGYANGTALYIMPRAELQILQHAQFPRGIANRHFKLASYTRTEEQELADALYILFAFDDTNCTPPGAFAATAKAEAIFLSWTYPDPPEDSTILGTDIWERASAAVTPVPGTDVPTFILRATGFNRGGLTAGDHKYYWALNRDTVGRSTLVGPVDATALAAATGPIGPTGNSQERRYIRSALVPSTPTGNNPDGWTVAIPSGNDALWASDATKDGSGNVVGSWSTPQRLSGSVIFYTSGAPSGHTLIDGDTYFDIADNFKIYRRDSGAWTAAFQPMIRLDGSNNITGLVKADGTNKDFVLIADKFQIWNGASAEVPFEIVGGVVYIKDAKIQNVGAGKITAGTINVALTLGVLGSITAGSGFGQFFVDDAELKHGVLTVKQYPSSNGTQLDITSGSHKVEAFAYNSGGDVAGLNVTNGSKSVQIQSTGLLRTNGPFEVTGAGSADFDCQVTANDHINLANGKNLNCGGDIYLGLSGVNRWLYDGNGNRLLQQRYGTGNPGASSDLASVIALANWLRDLALHHGLGS